MGKALALALLLCSALGFSPVASLRYDVQIDVGPEDFPAVKGSLNLLVVQGPEQTLHELSTT